MRCRARIKLVMLVAKGKNACEVEGYDVAAGLCFFGKAEEEEVENSGRLFEMVFIGAIGGDGRSFVVAEVVPGSFVDERGVPWTTVRSHVLEPQGLGLEQLYVVGFHIKSPGIGTLHLCVE